MLFVPAPGFTRQVNNAGECSNTGPAGTSYTAGESNVKGSVTQLLSALEFEAQLVIIEIGPTFVSATNTNALTDIVIDPAGGTSWDTTNILIPDLLSGWCISSRTFPKSYVFPVRIPKGASVGARGQTIRDVTFPATVDIPVIIYCFGGASPETAWVGQGVDAIAIDAANSKGQLHTPGVSQTFSSFASLGAPTARAYRALAFQAQGSHTDTNMIGQGLRFQFGIGGAQIGPDFYACCGGDENISGLIPTMPVYASVPSGTQLQVRATCSGGFADQIDVAAYGVY